MSPIESPYDVRFLTLVLVAMEAIEQLGLSTDKDPEIILAESLYKANRQINEIGEQPVANKLLRCYPILNDAIS